MPLIKGNYHLTVELLKKYPRTLVPALKGASLGKHTPLVTTLLTSSEYQERLTPSLIKNSLTQAATKSKQTFGYFSINWFDQHKQVLNEENLQNKIVTAITQGQKKETMKEIIGNAAYKELHELTLLLLNRFSLYVI